MHKPSWLFLIVGTLLLGTACAPSKPWHAWVKEQGYEPVYPPRSGVDLSLVFIDQSDPARFRTQKLDIPASEFEDQNTVDLTYESTQKYSIEAALAIPSVVRAKLKSSGYDSFGLKVRGTTIRTTTAYLALRKKAWVPLDPTVGTDEEKKTKQDLLDDLPYLNLRAAFVWSIFYAREIDYKFSSERKGEFTLSTDQVKEIQADLAAGWEFTSNGTMVYRAKGDDRLGVAIGYQADGFRQAASGLESGTAVVSQQALADWIKPVAPK